MKKTLNLSLGKCLALLGACMITGQAHGQSATFDFEDNTPQGWANAGFSGTPLATVANVGGSFRLYLPLGGFQVGNIGSGDTGSAFFQAMDGASANPANYTLSYDWYVDTAGFSGATFLQIGSFVNTGSGYYAQHFPDTGKEVELDGVQLASGQVFQGSVSINFADVGFNMPTGQTFLRLGLIQNGDGTGVGVYFDNISVTLIPEPTSLALIGLGLGGLLLMRRRNA